MNRRCLLLGALAGCLVASLANASMIQPDNPANHKPSFTVVIHHESHGFVLGESVLVGGAAQSGRYVVTAIGATCMTIMPTADVGAPLQNIATGDLIAAVLKRPLRIWVDRFRSAGLGLMQLGREAAESTLTAPGVEPPIIV